MAFDAKTVEAKTKDLNQRIADVKARRSVVNAYSKSVQESAFYENALLGKHPFLFPVESADEYLERYEYFRTSNEERIRELIATADSLPNVSKQSWFEPLDFRIGIIADTFLFKSFEGAAQFIPITPENYEETIPELDLLLVTSAWRGLDHEWFGLSIASSGKRWLVTQKIVPLAKQNGVPVAFYSKEDPPNFDVFAGLAKSVDFIFTSAIEVVHKYQRLTNDATPVTALPFSVNFAHHNPLGSMRSDLTEFVFGGSWHRKKYQARRRAGELIFDGILKAGYPLWIVDRNLEIGAEKYLYPEKYLEHLHGPLAHAELLSIQRLLPVSINLNSVHASQTMFANRVIELQAMGTCIVSNYSAGVNTQFPNVFMPDREIDMVQWLESLSLEDIRKAQVDGVRNAFTDNTNFDRVRAMLEFCGFNVPVNEPQVFVAGLNSDEYANFVAEQKTRLTLKQSAEMTSHEAEGRYVTLHVDVSKEHDPHFVDDLVNGFKYSSAKTVVSEGKYEGTYEMVPEGEHRVKAGEYAEVHGVSTSDPGVLTVPANQLVASRDRSVQSKIAVSEYDLTVVVPIYNNGRHLYYKCFDSLRRSSIFNKMKILLVDDGSTDFETRQIVQGLVAGYPNVEAFYHEIGGSGSASRPRNTGLELCDTKFITYLDPDNEAISDGFAELLKMIEETGVNFAIGNMVKLKHRRLIINNSGILRKALGSRAYDGADVPEDILTKIKFQPMSIQALVADAEWLKSLNLVQPVGAVGQDSYFFQQMLFYAKRIAVTETPIHTYYAAVSNSTVNQVGPKFYKKYIALEQDRATWLSEVGLLDSYNSVRLMPFVKGWYVDKLRNVAMDERDECKSTIRQLVGFYGNHPELDDLLQET